MNKTYQGRRLSAGQTSVLVDGLPLRPRLDIANHSPDGFEWGYGGSGPAQLALAILADHLGDKEAAQRLHQPFKWACIAKISSHEWSFNSAFIEGVLARLPVAQP